MENKTCPFGNTAHFPHWDCTCPFACSIGGTPMGGVQCMFPTIKKAKKWAAQYTLPGTRAYIVNTTVFETQRFKKCIIETAEVREGKMRWSKKEEEDKS